MIHDEFNVTEYENNLEALQEAKHWFAEVIHQAYVDGCVDGLENALEELGFALAIDIPKSDIKVAPVYGRSSLASDLIEMGKASMQLQRDMAEEAKRYKNDR